MSFDYAAFECRDCPIETGSDTKHAALIDKFAEKHVETERHTVTSGQRRAE